VVVIGRGDSRVREDIIDIDRGVEERRVEEREKRGYDSVEYDWYKVSTKWWSCKGKADFIFFIVER
jgi:hypothetical protein